MKKTLLALAAALVPAGLLADDEPELSGDYYLGFSQGAYYGLMLAGVDYHVAWCVKSELAYEGAAIGAGAEFQAKLEQIFANCRTRFALDAKE